MSLQSKLLLNYQSELKVVNNLKSSGHTHLEASIWDFTHEHEDDALVSIDEVIVEIENRIGTLANECTEETVNSLNY